jgi:hypothetical protein
MIRRISLWTSAGAMLVAAALGCGSDMKFAAPPMAMLQGGVSVTFKRATADEETLDVWLAVQNMSNQMMFVNRDGFGLRLPDGQILQRRGIQNVYPIPPGGMHDVHLEFEEKGFAPQKLPQASIIVGGISYSNDPTPRTVGEIPLTNLGPE